MQEEVFDIDYNNSIASYIEQELGLSIGDIWDFSKNTESPYNTSKKSHKEVNIICTKKKYHGTYKIKCSKFSSGQRCPMCSKKTGKIHPLDSFAQYHINNTDPLFLEKYWDWDKNNELGIDPWKISPKSQKKLYIKCQEEDYHKSYLISGANFSNGQRCGFCNGKITHPLDSFGYYHFDRVMSWLPDNNVSPFNIRCGSDFKAKFKCEKCGELFKARVANITLKSGWCPHCSQSNGEKKINDWLASNNISFIYDQTYFKDLIGLGGGILRPDFILPDHKIWIEYDGEFHYKDIMGNLKVQQHHDKLKDNYAKENGWKMIRIPYWEFDRIEEILEKIGGLIQ